MKKETKKILLVAFIALIMFSSSAIWILFSAIPGGSQQPVGQTQIPEDLIVEGYLSSDIASQLLQYGFSLLEWHYYEGCCPDLQAFVDALPTELDRQVVVQRVADAADVSWLSARSLRGERQWNVTSVADLLPPLCEVLLKPPVECGLMGLGNVTRDETG